MAPRVHEFPTVKLRRGSPDACQDQVWRGSSKIITFCFGAGPAGGAGRHQIGLAQTSPRARADPRAGGAIARMPAGSFMDYTMPRADDLPDIVSLLHPVRCATNPLGVKGVGETGTTASLAAVMNAVADAGGR